MYGLANTCCHKIEKANIVRIAGPLSGFESSIP
jgi:hypothetical protein